MRRVAARVPIWLVLPVALLALGALVAWASELGDTPIGPPPTPSLTVTPTASQTATATASTTATASPTPSPTPTSTPHLDRQACDEIRGTDYRSPSEREWFLINCVAPEATRQAQAPSVSLTALEDLVCSYDWDCAWALAVMYCESGGDPNAYNPAGPYVGLFQILDSSGSLSLLDPATNIAEAHWKYLAQGPGAWRGCP